ASRGMGLEIAKAALADGDSVVATGRSMEQLRAAYADAPQDRIELQVLDVSRQAHAQTAVDAAIARFGKIDVLVNNAGFCLLGRFEEATAAQIE
ncbi:SDR family NAD(P)-dependent oxidoreductase, partial [Klebsiella pneumoniae]|uniref:SDR family NAD(P)-dependent oxidoreductase n=2 Tax=Gammaproteobacteria TaxID=1236 RepID=UPI003F2133C2